MLIKARLLYWVMTCVLTAAAHAEADGASVSTASEKTGAQISALLKDLDADDFDARESARRKLIALGEPAREALADRISRMKGDPAVTAERVEAVQAVLTEIVGGNAALTLQSLRDSLQKKLDDATKAIEEVEAHYKVTLASLNRKLAARAAQDEERGDLQEKIADIRKDITARERAYFKLKRRLLSHIGQILSYLKNPEQNVKTLAPILEIGEWDPGLLPFAAQLDAQVFFEFTNITLEEACSELREMSGLRIELPADLRGESSPRLSLSSSGMKAGRVAGWIAELAVCKVTVDYARQTLLIEPNPAAK